MNIVLSGRSMLCKKKGLKPGGWCGSLIIVDAKTLCKALSNVADLIADNLARVIVLLLVYKLALQRLLAGRHI